MKFKILLISFLVVALTGCADSMTFEQAITADKVGFLHGVWHGLILPVSFFCSLLSDDVAIYAIYNNGGWYDFGFLFGAGGLGFGVGFFNE